MQYPSRLSEGQFLKRYKRFFADVELTVNGRNKKVVAHVANTGSLRGVCDKSAPCRVAYHNDPNRKLKYSLEHVQLETSWVGVNTRLANDIAAEAFELKLFKHWRHFSEMQREFRISDKTRLDFRFTDPRGHFHFVEVKSVSMATLGGGGEVVAQFPDSPTARGQKHLEELMALVQQGPRSKNSAEIFFVVQRTDSRTFSPAELIDKKYAELLRQAHIAGVQISTYAVDLTPDGAHFLPAPLKLDIG